MKVVFANRYFSPDHSATSQMLSDLAFGLAKLSRDVHVVTSRQRYEHPMASLSAHEYVNGVYVHRVWTTRFGRNGLIRRAVDYLTFYASAFVQLVLLVREGDIVVAKTDPPMLSVVAAVAARLRGAKLINWLQDLFPEIAAAADIGWAKGGAGRILIRFRDWSLRCAQQNVVVGEKMRDVLIARWIAERQVAVIPNWADGDAIRPIARMENPLRKKWSLEGKFVVGYSGNLGRVHEFDTVLGAMTVLREDEGKCFLFIGAGKKRQMLESECKTRGITTVSFQPYQAREDLIWSLGVPDVHLVTLLPEMEGLVVPSKFYGIAASGRPTIFIGDPEGEIPGLLRRFDCGIAIRQGDADGLAETILQMQRDEYLRERLGGNARNAFEANFERKIALKAWAKAIENASNSENNGSDRIERL